MLLQTESHIVSKDFFPGLYPHERSFNELGFPDRNVSKTLVEGINNFREGSSYNKNGIILESVGFGVCLTKFITKAVLLCVL